MSQLAIVQDADALTPGEARELTDRIRTAAESLSSLLLEAYSRGAWAALGYASWREYATEELSISQSRAYQLLDQAKVMAAITEAAGVSTSVEITEAAAREIKPHLAAVTEEIRSRVEAGEEPEAAVSTSVETVRKATKAAPAPEPEAEEEVHPEHGAAPVVDEAAELAHALEEVERLHAQVDALSASDLGAEVRKWTDRAARLEGRIQQMMQTEAATKEQVRYQSGLLKKIRGVLRVDRDAEIMPRLLEVAQ